MRDLLFGDLPLELWAPDPSEIVGAEPWGSFARARAALETGRQSEAVRVLSELTRRDGLESRHQLEAWHMLRGLGVLPEGPTATRVLGVVLEVGVTEGLDVVATYADRSARYLNYSGAVILWDAPDPSLDEAIIKLLKAGIRVAQEIGPWDGERPEPPEQGHGRLNVLTPGGLRFGQAGLSKLAEDPLAGPAMTAAYELMMALIAKTEEEEAP